MKKVKNDFQQLWTEISNNLLTYFSQSVFFFVSLFVLVFTNQIFLNMLVNEGNKVYSQIVESNAFFDFGPLALKVIFITVIWVLALSIVYTTFQGAIWCILSKVKNTKEKLISFWKQSIKWISILILLLYAHFLLSALLLSVFRSNPYSITSIYVLLSALQLVMVLYVLHGAVTNHAYFLTKKNADFKSAHKFAFKLRSLRTIFYYVLYLALMQIIGMSFIGFPVVIFIFVGVFLSLGTIAYYIMVLDVVKNEA